MENRNNEPLWDDIQRDQSIPVNSDNASWKAIRKRTGLRKRKLIRMLRRGSVATLIIFCSALAYVQHDRLSIATTSQDIPKTARVVGVVRKIQNNQKTAMKLFLPDSSVVVLEPGSQLSYDNKFGENSRESVLEGRAFFNVKKDLDKPFIVWSNNISTTALGTSFWIDAFPENQFMRVALITGKVVIREKAQAGVTVINPVYLSPGHQFSLSLKNHAFAVNKLKVQTSRTPEAILRKNIDTAYISTELHFENQPLEIVLNTLTKRFNTRITIDKKLVRNKLFTGSYNSVHDAIENILNDIASLNGLTILRAKNGFILIQEP